jgi:undecaprenyl diphosphate synthase
MPLDPAKLPRHVAVIMDGNGRWAAKRFLPLVAGHKAGVDSVREIVRACGELGIPALTLYSFSTENWLRPKEEVDELMRLLSWALDAETLELDKNNVRLGAIGRLDALPQAVQAQLAKSIEALSKNTGLKLTLALNYGGRQEILDAANKALSGGAKTLDEAAIEKHLYTSHLPELDLVIRTSGEMRISNFLLWQAAYAELHVTPTLWPDFRKPHLIEALEDFQKRDRRFGGLTTKS